MKKIRLGKQVRSIALDGAQLDEETRSVEFSFSSEFPVDRWFGREVLSHEPGAADLARLQDGGQLLFNHDMNDYIGVVERAEIRADKRGYVAVRFSKNERADQILQDVRDGILRNVSFGYQIQDMKLARKGENGPDEYIATRWTPYEVSLVTVPADPTIGVGRAADEDTDREFEFEDETKENAGEVPASKGEQRMEIDMKVVQSEAAKAERERIASINSLGEKFGQSDLARQLVESGRSIEDARGAFLEKLGAVQKPVGEGAANVDLTEKEKRAYSLVRAINASISKDWSQAGFELEVSREITKRTGKETAGFFMPMNVELNPEQTRATYAVGAAGTGGNLVATNLLAGSFIDILRNKAMVVQMGARMLSGLVGNVAIPRQNVATAAAWVTEGNAPSQAEATFDQVTMTPKQIAARSQMTRLMLQQATPDIEAIVRQDLALQLALAIDLAAINGVGTGGVPRGILQTSGIGSVAMGTNGAAITIDALIDLEERVATGNADAGSLGYLTTPKVVAALKKLKGATSGDYLWTQSMTPAAVSGVSGAINGYQVGKSNQVPANLTKGSGTNLNAVIFGDFSQLMIGEWGVLEILPNPYGAGYNAGSVDIRAMQTVDVAVRQPAGFAAIVDAIA